MGRVSGTREVKRVVDNLNIVEPCIEGGEGWKCVEERSTQWVGFEDKNLQEAGDEDSNSYSERTMYLAVASCLGEGEKRQKSEVGLEDVC